MRFGGRYGRRFLFSKLIANSIDKLWENAIMLTWCQISFKYYEEV